MRRPETLGATASVAMTVTALTVIAATGAALGFLHPKAAAAATPQAAVTADSTATITGQAAPARAAVLTFLGKDVTWGVKIPTRFGCHAPTAAISAGVTDGTTAQVFLPGQAVPALDALAACGTRIDVNGTTGVKMTAVGGVVIAWTRGDVLATVSASAPDTAHLNDVDNRLTAALTGPCANLNPTAADATRNPLNAHYAPYTVQVTVDAPPAPTPQATSTATPTLSSTPAPAPTPSPAPTGLPTTPPAGVSGPPLPTPVASPTAPTSPDAKPTQAVISVQAADPVGPGCGWAFTGQPAPKADVDALAKASQQAQDNARLDLLTRQQQWAADTSTYTQALADYTAAITAWNAYTDQLRLVVGQWVTQKSALDAYQHDLDVFTTATTVQQTFLATQASAQALYDSQVQACATAATSTPAPKPSASPSSSPTPSPSLSSAVSCPVVRPAILDQPTPTVPPQPTPPPLWPTITPTPAPVSTPTPQPTKKR